MRPIFFNHRIFLAFQKARYQVQRAEMPREGKRIKQRTLAVGQSLPAPGHAREGNEPHTQRVLLETADPAKDAMGQRLSGRVAATRFHYSTANLAAEVVRPALLPGEISALHRR